MWIQEKKVQIIKSKQSHFAWKEKKTQAVRPKTWDMSNFFRHRRKIVAGTLIAI